MASTHTSYITYRPRCSRCLCFLVWAQYQNIDIIKSALLSDQPRPARDRYLILDTRHQVSEETNARPKTQDSTRDRDRPCMDRFSFFFLGGGFFSFFFFLFCFSALSSPLRKGQRACYVHERENNKRKGEMQASPTALLSLYCTASLLFSLILHPPSWSRVCRAVVGKRT